MATTRLPDDRTFARGAPLHRAFAVAEPGFALTATAAARLACWRLAAAAAGLRCAVAVSARGTRAGPAVGPPKPVEALRRC
jgi:hypothetical protein